MASRTNPVLHVVRILVALAAATVGMACLPVATQATETISSKLAFVPYKLGAGTTIVTEGHIGTTNRQSSSNCNFPRA
jgi:hypothetical protein